MPSKSSLAIARCGCGSCRNESLNSLLRQGAIRRGLCEQWQRMWSDDLSPEVLCDIFKRGQDFCILNDWPSVAFIRDNFPPSLLRDSNIFLDKEASPVFSERGGVFICLSDAEIDLSFGKWAVATVYARHDSKISVQAPSSAKIQVRLFDRARCSAAPQVRIIDRTLQTES